MKKSYHLSKALIPSHFVSKHWDIYPKSFEITLFDKEKLSKFRNNELSFKCNDSLEKRTSSKELRVLESLSHLVNKEFIETNNNLGCLIFLEHKEVFTVGKFSKSKYLNLDKMNGIRIINSS